MIIAELMRDAGLISDAQVRQIQRTLHRRPRRKPPVKVAKKPRWKVNKNGHVTSYGGYR